MTRLLRLPALLLATSLAWSSLGSVSLAQITEPPPPISPPSIAESTPAAAPEAAAGEPTVEQRVADLEQYFQNLGVGAAGDAKWNSKIADVPGPATTAG